MPSTRISILMLTLAIFCVNFGDSIIGYIFNNYLDQIHHLSPESRGFMEFPRELPGILSVFAVGMLYFWRENEIAAFAAVLMGVGTVVLGASFISDNFSAMVALVMIASLGQHILLVISDAIVIHSSSPEKRGNRLGQIRSLITAAQLAGALFVWLKWKYLSQNFSVDFICSGVMCLAGAFFFHKFKSDKFPEHKSFRQRFVFKRAYSLYYVLETFFGARKQVFITFGFWVIVAVLGKGPAYIAKILLIASVLGLFFRLAIGKAIELYGERAVLIADSAVMFLICLGYAFALDILPRHAAELFISGCFIVDSMMFATGAARSSLMAKISEKKEDITPSLYTGMAVNHVVSIGAAVIGGALWKITGSHTWVFVFAAGLALCSGATAFRIKLKSLSA